MNYPNLMAIVFLCFLLLTAGCYNTTTEQREDPSTELVIDWRTLRRSVRTFASAGRWCC